MVKNKYDFTNTLIHRNIAFVYFVQQKAFLKNIKNSLILAASLESKSRRAAVKLMLHQHQSGIFMAAILIMAQTDKKQRACIKTISPEYMGLLSETERPGKRNWRTRILDTFASLFL